MTTEPFTSRVRSTRPSSAYSVRLFPCEPACFRRDPYHFAIRRPAIEDIDSEKVFAAVVRLLAFQATRLGPGHRE
jgi:hypothetical protein